MPLILSCVILLFSCSEDDASVLDELPSTEKPETVAEQLGSAQWEINEVGQQVAWKCYHFDDLFNSNQSITVFEINRVSDKVTVKIPYVESGFLKTIDAAIQKQALVAINGSYFDTKEGGSTVFFKNEDTVINETRIGFNSYRENAGFGINSSGKVSIIVKPTYGWKNKDYSTYWCQDLY